jgi:hypothetical protein
MHRHMRLEFFLSYIQGPFLNGFCEQNHCWGDLKKTLNLISLTKFKTLIDLKIMSTHSFRKNLLKIINSIFLSLYIYKKQIILS